MTALDSSTTSPSDCRASNAIVPAAWSRAPAIGLKGRLAPNPTFNGGITLTAADES